MVRSYGSVSLDGEPLANAQVRFKHPLSSETLARTDSNGDYEMEFTFNQKGAFLGENVVSFTTVWDVGEPEKIPSHYLIDKSNLTVEITDGGSPYNFALTTEEKQPE